jgi:hypothetical protein
MKETLDFEVESCYILNYRILPAPTFPDGTTCSSGTVGLRSAHGEGLTALAGRCFKGSRPHWRRIQRRGAGDCAVRFRSGTTNFQDSANVPSLSGPLDRDRARRFLPAPSWGSASVVT